MQGKRSSRVLYWDSSALLSVVIDDAHTEAARGDLKGGSVHLVSTLAFAEVMAVLGRVSREAKGGAKAAETARKIFLAGPWRWLNAQPDRNLMAELSSGAGLRGADLWHFALFLTVRESLPELELLTFDAALAGALNPRIG